ncbi:hypothetical protein, partial [Bacillus subtilis]|uniref:hypothetical protein n=1 Tax=Bacillus subtilis TaxID=1423 RepID=UPI00295E49DD
IGERQILPRQTNRTLIIKQEPPLFFPHISERKNTFAFILKIFLFFSTLGRKDDNAIDKSNKLSEYSS